MDQAAEECAGSQHLRPTSEFDPHLGPYPNSALALDEHVIDRLLEQLQVRLSLEAPANRLPIEHAVGLCARGADCRALRSIESTELDACLVGSDGHRAAERVNFLHQVALADPADRWVARHLTQGLDAMGQQKRALRHSRGGERGFSTGMAAADNNDVEVVRKPHWGGEFYASVVEAG